MLRLPRAFSLAHLTWALLHLNAEGYGKTTLEVNSPLYLMEGMRRFLMAFELCQKPDPLQVTKQRWVTGKTSVLIELFHVHIKRESVSLSVPAQPESEFEREIYQCNNWRG